MNVYGLDSFIVLRKSLRASQALRISAIIQMNANSKGQIMELVNRKKPKIIRSVRYNKDKDPEKHFGEQLMQSINLR